MQLLVKLWTIAGAAGFRESLKVEKVWIPRMGLGRKSAENSPQNEVLRILRVTVPRLLEN